MFKGCSKFFEFLANGGLDDIVDENKNYISINEI